MLSKHRNEMMYFHDLKKKLCCEIERIEANVCGGCRDISYDELHTLKDLVKTAYYLDCITKGYHMHEAAMINVEKDVEAKEHVKAKAVLI